MARHAPRLTRGIALAVLLATAVLALPSFASATVPGPNGKIVFVSGRGGPANDDSQAKIYLLTYPNGPITQFTTAAGQHRHPNWSPDRSKIVYALFNGVNDRDLWIHDVRTNGRVRINLSPTTLDDRPSWSPDGTRIAFESEVTAGSGQQDILIYNVANGQITNLTSTPGTIEGKPDWSPDSQTIYYSFQVAAGNNDIYKEPANNAQVLGTPVITTAVNEFQPAVSADGTKLCYTRGPVSDGADVYTALISGLNQTNLSDNAATGDYNCAWSPDGTKITFVKGIFPAGALVQKNSNDTGAVTILTDVSQHFDGNPNWAVNPRPTCQNVGPLSVPFNSFRIVQMSCSDPENQSLTYQIASNPPNGILGGLDSTDGTVAYTPNVNFSGGDSFTYTASDGTSSATPAAAVGLSVAAAPTPTTPTTPTTGGGDTQPAVISLARVSPFAWRRGTALPVFLKQLRRSPLGTRISFRLSERAGVRLTFARTRPGRRVGTRCLANTPARRGRPKCTRVFPVIGSYFFQGKQGLNQVRFQGRITRTRRLGTGTHLVRINATDAAGNASKQKSASFRINAR